MVQDPPVVHRLDPDPRRLGGLPRVPGGVGAADAHQVLHARWFHRQHPGVPHEPGRQAAAPHRQVFLLARLDEEPG